jgi:glycine/D-amino acid oxidase-like deaminating enzyme
MLRDVSDTSDVVVVGAGIFGAATAHALCRERAGRVTLIDRGAPAAGDSGRSFSMVRRHYSNAVTARLAIAGSRTIMRFADEVGVADAGYVRCGYLLTVPERLVDACRANVELLRGLGLDTRFITPDEIGAAEPELSLDGVAGAAYEPDGGFADAQKMCLGWYAAASRLGLDGRLGSEVTSLIVDGGRIRGVETDRGAIHADRVVLATGAWGNELLRPHGAEQPIALRRIQVSILRQPIGGALPIAVCSDAVTNVVVRPDRGQQFYAVAYFGDEPLDCADDCDHGISPGYEEAVRRAVSERYPRLGGFELVRGFAGPYDHTPDWNPIVGPCPGIEGLYLALGWSGHGFKLSPAVGEVVAAEVIGRTPPIDVSELRPERFAEGRLLRLAYGPGARA